LVQVKDVRQWGQKGGGKVDVPMGRYSRVVVMLAASGAPLLTLSALILQATKYLIHYEGWRASYDEWVLPERLLKLTEENLEIERQRIEQLECVASHPHSKPSLHSNPSSSSSALSVPSPPSLAIHI